MVPADSEDTAATVNDEADENAIDAADDPAESDDADGGDEAVPPLTLDVKIETRSTCQRHIIVTIAAEDVERYFEKKFTEMMPTVNVPGFRPGRAPRKLVESRFRKEVAEQVKGSLLMDSLAQVNEDHKLVAIGEPDFDVDAIEVPTAGPMTFEFDLEVRPEFDMPQWKGLQVDRPTYSFTKTDVDRRLEQILSNSGQLAPLEGPAEPDDYINCRLAFRHDGNVLSRSDEETIRIRPTLSFRDGNVEGFDALMVGVRAGETREGKAKISASAANEALRNQEVDAVFEVLEVKRLELPELTPDLLQELGDFETEGDLRDAILEDLKRQLGYQRQQWARRQITAELTKNANWELPPDLLKRQGLRELERSVMELQRSGFGDDEIRAHANELRQNSMVATARSLKEHFILERIAEDEKIDANEYDYDEEIRLIAAQSSENVRRVRARLEKRGLMDVLRNQIIERKVIDRVLEHAKFTNVPYTPPGMKAEAIDHAVGGGETHDEIPHATHPGEPETLKDLQDAEPRS